MAESGIRQQAIEMIWFFIATLRFFGKDPVCSMPAMKYSCYGLVDRQQPSVQQALDPIARLDRGGAPRELQYEENVDQCDSTGRVARGHGGWPKTV